MKLEIKDEINALYKAREELKKKLTEQFEGKWIVCTQSCNFRRDRKFSKNKAGDLILFKIETCRPKACALESNMMLNELVLSGKDTLGSLRTEVIQRVGYTKGIATSISNPDEYEYNVPLFNTKEEAVLYATLQEQLYPKDDIPF